jgi:hypothetical protein
MSANEIFHVLCVIALIALISSLAFPAASFAQADHKQSETAQQRLEALNRNKVIKVMRTALEKWQEKYGEYLRDQGRPFTSNIKLDPAGILSSASVGEISKKNGNPHISEVPVSKKIRGLGASLASALGIEVGSFGKAVKCTALEAKGKGAICQFEEKKPEHSCLLQCQR